MNELLARCGISFDPGQLEKLWTYHQLLRERTEELNLTRVHNFENMVLKLYVDSILPGLLMDLPSPLLDLGTGPGMPGILLKIAFPRLEVVLAESRRNRVEFLEEAVKRLRLEGVEIVGEGITPRFERPASGVVTRAVESIAQTLERIGGCLRAGGLAVFMKGPQCGEEIEEASKSLSLDYRLRVDRSYRIPGTPHERRLVVFERLSEPRWARKASAMERHPTRRIESDQNELFKDLKKLATARGIRKQRRALVYGKKLTHEAVADFPERCLAWIGTEEQPFPPENLPEAAAWYLLSPALFRVLDQVGTNEPLLLVSVPEAGAWKPSDGLPEGCSVLVPFQDPENVGAVVRSAVAFGASRIILLEESAHPYHPKALRASGGAVFRAQFLEGPSIRDLPDDLAVMPLSAEGRDISTVSFPGSFALLPGLEGPGLPESFRKQSLSIPMLPAVESLNAAAATAIALYVWFSSRRK
ncbi:MAG: 16S rRNA (guanine(527)-N(7))-methyltransferase RsmG [Desulfobacteraceae bacterium]|nr:16S rRNA (guanine(527)-N(7))-methyltransferase RsmG [Desulfobacteraceae bacterium]